MVYPDSVLNVIESCAERWPNDIDTAKAKAKEKITRLPEYGVLVSSLVDMAIADLIYKARHKTNVRIRRENGAYDRPSQVLVGESEGVRQVCQNAYTYHIAGMCLGDVMGENLLSIADKEQAVANGHIFNVRLCQALRPLVPDNKKVREVVPEKKLRGIFKKLAKEDEQEAA